MEGTLPSPRFQAKFLSAEESKESKLINLQANKKEIKCQNQINIKQCWDSTKLTVCIKHRNN